MTVIPPISGIQAGHTSGGGFLSNLMGASTSGGGLLSSLTGGAAGGPAQTTPGQVDPGPKGDGSVGLFDGVLKKTLIGGAAGAAFGFIPFLPGGPVLGGVMGALSGAAMGMFSNWSKMKAIKAENQATMAALGVQSSDPNINKVMETGQVSQLIPMMTAQQGGVTQQTGTQQTPVTQQTGQSIAGADTGPGTVPIGIQTPAGRIATVTDPATGVSQRVNVDTGQVVEEGTGTAITAQQQAQAIANGQLPNAVNTSQSPIPTQGSIAVGTGAAGSGAATAAINPNAAVNPGVAPALQGGGDSAGTAGAPPAPVAVAERTDSSAITPNQAALAEADPAVTEQQAERRKLDKAQLAKFIQSLQSQIDQLKEYLAEQDRTDELDKAAAR